jgi:hypothetical protein
MRKAGRQKETWCRAALTALIGLALLGSPLRADALPPALQGRWAGTLGPGTVPLEIGLAPAGSGFTLHWTPPGGGPEEVRFAATERPGVFAASEGEGWSMFERKAPVNPLQGAALRWARSAPDALYLYSLRIDDRGAFVLDRYACRPEEGALRVAWQRQRPEGPEPERAGRLTRTGG